MSYTGYVLLRGGIIPDTKYPQNMPLVDASHVWVAQKTDAEEGEDIGFKLSDMLINVTGTEKLFNGLSGQYLKLNNDKDGNHTLVWGTVSSELTTDSVSKYNPVNSDAVNSAMTVRLTGINAADITAGDNNKILIADYYSGAIGTKGYRLVSIEDLIAVYTGES